MFVPKRISIVVIVAGFDVVAVVVAFDVVELFDVVVGVEVIGRRVRLEVEFVIGAFDFEWLHAAAATEASAVAVVAADVGAKGKMPFKQEGQVQEVAATLCAAEALLVPMQLLVAQVANLHADVTTTTAAVVSKVALVAAAAVGLAVPHDVTLSS